MPTETPSPVSTAARRVPWWVTLIDVVALGALVLLASALLVDGVKVKFADVRITATSVWKLGGVAALLLIARHALFRHPTWLARAQRVVQRVRLDAGVRWAWPWVATTRLTVLAASYAAVLVIGYPEGAPPFRASPNEFDNLLARWDSGWYMGIVEDGYNYWGNARHQTNVAFFPAYPLTVRAVGGLLGARWGSPDDPTDTFDAFNERRGVRLLRAGWLVSIACLLAAMAYLFRLARELTESEEAARRAVVMASVYPFAFFFGAVYTESFFLLFVLAAFYHFRHQQWLGAGLAGLVAGLARPNGCLVSVPLALLAVDAWRRDAYRPATLARGLATAAMPGVGMLLFTWWLHGQTGEWFMWMKAHGAWGREFTALHVMLAHRWQQLLDLGLYGYTAGYTVDLFNMAATLLALGVTWPVARRYGIAYAALILITIVPPLFMGGFLSLGRVSATLFPLYIYLGARISTAALPHVTVVMFGLQVALAVMHFTWRQVY
jgi:Gpi18-like mannosyltransferase